MANVNTDPYAAVDEMTNTATADPADQATAQATAAPNPAQDPYAHVDTWAPTPSLGTAALGAGEDLLAGPVNLLETIPNSAIDIAERAVGDTNGPKIPAVPVGDAAHQLNRAAVQAAANAPVGGAASATGVMGGPFGSGALPPGVTPTAPAPASVTLGDTASQIADKVRAADAALRQFSPATADVVDSAAHVGGDLLNLTPALGEGALSRALENPVVAAAETAAEKPAPVRPLTEADILGEKHIGAEPATVAPAENAPASSAAPAENAPAPEPHTPAAEQPQAANPTGTPKGSPPLFKPAGDENARVIDRTPEERAQLVKDMQTVGMTETPKSVLAGDRLEQASDMLTAKNRGTLPGARMVQVLAHGRDSLRTYFQDLITKMGGATEGSELSAKQTAGAALRAPVTGFEDALDSHVTKLYEDAKAKHANAPPTEMTALQAALAQRSAFSGTEQGTRLLGGIQDRMRELGIQTDPATGKITATPEQAERLRQYIGEHYHPQNAKAGYLVKNALDDDVTRALGEQPFQAGRAVRTLKAKLLEEQPATAKLMGPEDKLGIAHKVADEDVSRHLIEKQPVAQFKHYIAAVRTAAKMYPELAPTATRALNELRTRMLQGIVDAGDKTAGIWNSKAVGDYLRANDAKFKAIFSPQELDLIRAGHDVGQALNMPRDYEGAAAQEINSKANPVVGHLAGAAINMGVGAAAAHTGMPLVGAAADAAGGMIANAAKKTLGDRAQRKALEAVEKRISQLKDEPTAVESPKTGARGPGAKERGGPKFTQTTHKGKYAIEHEEDRDTNMHRIKSANGETLLQEQNNGNLKAYRSDTDEAFRRSGEGTARLAASADLAHSRGGDLESDHSVSPGEAGAYGALQKSGYRVTRSPHATVNPTTGNLITHDMREPVFKVHRPEDRAANGQRAAFAGQRGGPKFTTMKMEPDDYDILRQHVLVPPNASMRERWDALWRAQDSGKLPPNFVNDLYKKGLNDDHIDTALRALSGRTIEGESKTAPGKDVVPLSSKFPGQRGGPRYRGRKTEDMVSGKPSENMTFRHFSNETSDRLNIDPRYYGKGLTGAERVRMKNENAPKVSAAYAANHPDELVEPGLKGKTEYRVTVPRSKMYDLSADPEGIRAAATEGGRYDHSEAERQIAKRGYTGYYTPHHENPLFRGQARFFKPVQGVKAGPGATVNIGLKVGEKGSVSPADAAAALQRSGVHIRAGAVHASATEPTLVAKLDRPLTPEEAHAVSVELHQEAIAQHANGKGELYGPGAEKWRPFQGQYFLGLDGKPIEPAREPLKQNYDPADHLLEQGVREHMAAAHANPGAKRPPLLQEGKPAQPMGQRAAFAGQRGGPKQAPAIPRSVGQHMTPEEHALFTRDAAHQDLVRTFHEVPSTKELGAMALAGQAKKGWYKRATHSILNVFGGDAPRFTALLAAMSPQTSVEMNFHNALHSFVAWVKAGRPTDAQAIGKILEENSLRNPDSKSRSNVLDAWRYNAIRALTAKDPDSLQLSGPKVDSFYENLRGNVNEVTLDTWMAQVAGIDPNLLGGLDRKAKDGLSKTFSHKSPGYVGYAAKVRATAGMLTRMTGKQWTPAEVQETVWSWAKAASERAQAESREMGPLGRSIPELVKEGGITDDLVKGTSDFHTLFERPEHRDVLADSEFASGLARLQRGEGEGAEQGTASEAEASARRDLAPHLHKAARRLEKSRTAEAPF